MTGTHHTDYRQTLCPPIGSSVFSLIVAILWTLITMACAQEKQPPWFGEGAFARIRVAPAMEQAHVLYVTIPSGLEHTVTGVAAYTSQGTPLQASPVQCGNDIVAGEIHIGPAFREALRQHNTPPNLPVHMYLLDKNESPRPLTQATDKPVAMRWANEKLLTRPYTCPQFLMLDARSGPFTHSKDFSDFGSSLNDIAAWPQQHNKQVARLHWQTQVRIDHAQDVRFGTNTPHTAWFLFVDGTPAAHWKNVEYATENVQMSAPLKLTKGLHRIDLHALAGNGESIPRLLWRVNNQAPAPLAGTAMHSAHQNNAYAVEYEKPAIAPQLRIDNLKAYLFPHVDTSITVFTPHILPAPTSAEVSLQLLAQNKPASSGETVFAKGRSIPAMTLANNTNDTAASLCWPPRAVWLSPTVAQAHIIIEQIPVTVLSSAPLPIECRLENAPPELLEEAGDHITFVWQAYHRKGTVAAKGSTNPHRPQETTTITVPLQTEFASISIYCAVDDIPITPSVTVRLIMPDDDLAELQPRGGRLLQRGDAAVLLVPPPQTFTHNTASSATSVTIVDDYWVRKTAPDATLTPETWLGERTSLQVTYVSTNGRSSADALPDLQKFGLMPRALNTSSETVLWAVGVTDLLEQVSVDELLRRLLFMAQATLARGKIPILMTAPPLPSVDSDVSRRAALKVKRMCQILDIPVVDLYSRVLADEWIKPGLPGFRVAPKSRMPLDTLNNEGREWLYGLILETLTENTSQQ